MVKLDEYKLIKISLCSFLILFVVIFGLEMSFEKKLTEISQIDMSYIDKKVMVYAYAKDVNSFSNHTFFLISDNNEKTISGIVFYCNSCVEENTFYVFEGKITLYNGELDLIVEKISR